MGEKFFKREELVGKLVINQQACIEGKIKDLALTEDGKMGLLVEREEDIDILINLEDIEKIRDVILLKPKGAVREASTLTEATPQPAEPKKQPPKKTSGNICPSCGHENKTAVNFCVKCGEKLQ